MGWRLVMLGLGRVGLALLEDSLLPRVMRARRMDNGSWGRKMEYDIGDIVRCKEKMEDA